MEVSSNFSKGFTDEDEEEDDFGKRDTPAAAADLTVRMDGKTNIDQKPTTPRSKHSVTEQRRRSKINDRFQVLRDLIPHNDQKRDKASFLLEVIEYIQFLQEKVQSYESAYPGWNQENPNLMPWVKVLFRSFWEKAQKKYQAPAEGLTDHSQLIKNDGPHSPSFIFPVSERVTATQCILPNNQHSAEYENMSPELASKAVRAPDSLQQYEFSSGSPHRQALISDLPHATSLSPSSAACHEIHADQNLSNDDDNVSISSVYSQSLLQVLTQSLHSSGVDISQANISVQIILGKSPWKRTKCSQKGYRELPVDSCCTEPEQLQKRHKSDVN